MSAWQTVVLAAIQGLAELLPVSSSAHVVVAEKLMHLDPSAPRMTLLLVMLHTGTMFAVIAYFWSRWRTDYFRDRAHFARIVWLIVVATALTAIVGGGLILLLEHTLLARVAHGEIEDLFSHLELIAPALAVGGVLILIAGVWERRRRAHGQLGASSALLIGAVQGLSLPFRGFSRSGATISTALLRGIERAEAETFSFALAVVLTPPVLAREVLRLLHASRAHDPALAGALGQSLFGGLCAFVAGLIALKWLSAWLEQGRWYLFGIYCLIAAGVVEALYRAGY
jgi:undecaprenyl-diphosphatase